MAHISETVVDLESQFMNKQRHNRRTARMRTAGLIVGGIAAVGALGGAVTLFLRAHFDDEASAQPSIATRPHYDATAYLKGKSGFELTLGTPACAVSLKSFGNDPAKLVTEIDATLDPTGNELPGLQRGLEANVRQAVGEDHELSSLSPMVAERITVALASGVCEELAATPLAPLLNPIDYQPSE